VGTIPPATPRGRKTGERHAIRVVPGPTCSLSTPPDKSLSSIDPAGAGARERRYATVLFSDVSGFTALSRKMDHEDVAELTNDCLDVMKAEVVRQQGYVIKRIGDCILAVFGAPQVLEDAPTRAVNAAIEMHKRVREFAKAHGVDLDIHTGVNTGELTAGHAEGIYDVWGDTVNLASRIEGQCPKGSIYVGAGTHRYTRDDFEYRSVGKLDLKNVEKPIEAFEVLSRRERVYRRRAVGSGALDSSAAGPSSASCGDGSATCATARARSCFSSASPASASHASSPSYSAKRT